MSLSLSCRLVAGIAFVAAVAGATVTPAGPGARAATRAVQVADILNLDIFRRRGFPLATCEARCQDARNRCEDRARNSDDRRDCRLEYSVCSNDCNVYESR